MIKLVVTNQRGGVGKTTTALTLARHLAERKNRVLVVDTDPQSSVALSLRLKPENFLYHFIVKEYVFNDCIVRATDHIHLMCSNRETVQAEAALMGAVMREQAFIHYFTPVEEHYDVIIFDVAPSVTLLQTCALVYTGKALIPVDMDPLSFHGVVATYELTNILNKFVRTNIQIAGILPTQVNKRLQMTEVISKSLLEFATAKGIAILPEVRTDTTVAKAVKERIFIQDYDPNCKAAQDYDEAFKVLLRLLKEPIHEKVSA